MRSFASGFFVYYLPPKPLIIALGSFQTFLKISREICKSRCTTGAGGNLIYKKKSKVKNLVTLSLKNVLSTLFSKQGSRTADPNLAFLLIRFQCIPRSLPFLCALSYTICAPEGYKSKRWHEFSLI